ncbi:hypothetical protein METBIDRAFT_47316 [Metschnikowia bicuspidata var. bicuspidata NRRL YB-4993]|uniref:Spindle assembly checkpoint component MAD1 n=1 Tax=Metschnikowia bicuspidata var. bicuspidata NRRL YB-4993 TaxID=869754 RepID=A0A1A0H4H8_9ASCO|nr:hypothetical protein METBIDRAFT_47316 [Metschnikowia bicuspidata var. bicuspidata NRRL YB-4993]OBA18946.1 hypothetical protein METBIDRAFT_47316 [Metschnikowia bicuspidata var. bicuspidata NRRL YB-4993]
MTEGSLSPFLERPLHVDGSHSTDKEKLARLEYELASMKTEKRLLEQSKESCVARYELLLSRKNEEFSHLQSNFDFVYNQRKELQLKVKNQAEVLGKSSSDSEQQVRSLASENKKLTAKIDKFERALQKETGQREHLCSDLNRELAANDQYRERISVLEAENKKLVEQNTTLLERSSMLSALLESEYARKNEDLNLRVLSLQKTNNELQFKFDLILQLKTSIELLKLKNASLSQKLKSLEATKSHASQLELENAALQAKFDEYFGVISATVECHNSSSREEVVTNFVQAFKMLQNKNLVLMDKLNQFQAEISELQQSHQNLRDEIDSEHIPQINSLRTQLSTQKNIARELEKVKILNGKEIEFLRKSLKDMDDLTSKRKLMPSSLTPDNTEKVAMNQYLTNLEKLVDEYKQEIEQLRKESNKEHVKHNLPTKRPRLIEEDDVKTKSTHSLTENLELLAQIKILKDECDQLRKKLRLFSEDASRSSQQILELRSNPFSADQLIKQETLDLLRKENLDLIGKYLKSENIDSIPKSLFVRQENDKEILQSKINNLLKQISRLKSVYAEKSRDIVAILSRFFGYKIEFIPSPVNPNDLCSKIKLVSKYVSSEHSDSSAPYLIIDVHTKTLKANGNFEFKNICEELVDQWVSEKHLIPCFLSALNLRIYEDSNRLK